MQPSIASCSPAAAGSKAPTAATETDAIRIEGIRLMWGASAPDGLVNDITRKPVPLQPIGRHVVSSAVARMCLGSSRWFAAVAGVVSVMIPTPACDPLTASRERVAHRASLSAHVAVPDAVAW